MMLNYSKFDYLMKLHKYEEATVEARKLHYQDRSDIGPEQCLAEALLAIGNYADALPILERVDSRERSDKAVPGRSGRRIWMACAHWMLGDQSEAIRLMSEMVNGILDRSIVFGDAAGGVQQGILLYYMGVTTRDEAVISKALSYLQTRTKGRAIELFPGPVAKFYLDEIDFANLLLFATKGEARNVAEATEVARTQLLSRRWLCVTLFHDGVKARARDDERKCEIRMQESFSLENPLLEPEWYLARYEVERAAASVGQVT